MDLPPQKIGKKFKFKNQLFWAVNGRVYIEDQISGEFKTCSRQDFKMRAIGFNDVVQQKWNTLYPDEKDELSNCVIAMCEVIKEAKYQGDPDIPGVIHQVAKENRKTSWLVGSTGDAYTRPTTPNRVIFLPGSRIESEVFRNLEL